MALLRSASRTRSPLKDKPLRLPGQSVAEERDSYLENSVGQPAMLALMMVLLAALEWWRWYTDMKPSPLVFTIAAGLALTYAVVRIWRALPRLRRLRQGLEGERAVGQFLERLRERGYVVFHDVVGAGFNVDHVLIGPKGVVTVETKTWAKPLTGQAKIVFDGETIRVGRALPDRDPVAQARAQASWIGSILAESTGQRIEVRAVVVFPGWFIETPKGAFKDVWVLEPKALPGFLDKEQVRLSRESVKLASFHLSRYIRGAERDRAS